MRIGAKILVFFLILFLRQINKSSDTTTEMFSSKGVNQGTTEEDLAEDHRGEHEGVKYTCGQCGKHFSQKGNLATHKRGVHEGVKYPCGQCDKHVSNKGNLNARQST